MSVAQTITAVTTGPVASVDWILTRRSNSALLKRSERPVVRAGGQALCVIEHVFPEEREDFDCDLVATAVLPADLKGDPLRRKIGVRVVMPAIVPRVRASSRSLAIGQRVNLEVECAQRWERARWDFGDGSAEDGTVATAAHRYDRSGTYRVQVTLSTSTGRTGTATCAIDVTRAPVQARPRVGYDGRLVGPDAPTVELDGVVSLQDDSVGDIASRRWLVDGVELPPSHTTLPLHTLGDHKLALVVTGKPDQKGHSDTSTAVVLVSVVRPADRVLAVILIVTSALAIFALLVVVARICSGNALSTWSVAAWTDTAGHHGAYELPLWSRWSLWRKRASVGLADLGLPETWTTALPSGSITIDQAPYLGEVEPQLSFSIPQGRGVNVRAEDATAAPISRADFHATDAEPAIRRFTKSFVIEFDPVVGAPERRLHVALLSGFDRTLRSLMIGLVLSAMIVASGAFLMFQMHRILSVRP